MNPARSPIILQSFVAIALIVFCVLSREIPHEWNFTPLMAVSLFSAWLFPRIVMGAAVPLLAMIISNWMIGGYNSWVMLSVYAAFLLPFLFRGLLRKRLTPAKLIGAAFASSFGFFVITNGAVWAFSSYYAKDLSGLLLSLQAGLPFWRNDLLATGIWSSVLFGSFALTKPLAAGYWHALLRGKSATSARTS